MSKNIVFCADGSWNGPGKDFDDNEVSTDPSNVLKLYHWLAGRDTIGSTKFAGEAERMLVDPTGKVIQVSKYIDGVGYDSNWLVKVLGGVFGAGLITRLVRGYTFISRNYELGDKIHIYGFSRGAYTARALADFIVNQGLLDATKIDLTQKEDAYRMGCAAWSQYQKSRTLAKGGNFLQKLNRTLVDLPLFFTTPSVAPVYVSARVELVGVWDTVGALGIPFYGLHDGRIDAFEFAGTNLHPHIAHGRHGISLDEMRIDFTPNIWSPRENVNQVLFAGAHADIGGSYPSSESGLSDCALNWMVEESIPVGVLFDKVPDGYAPCDIGRANEPWECHPFDRFPAQFRFVRKFPDFAGLKPHASLTKRIGQTVNYLPSGNSFKYAPANIPIV